MFKEKIAIVVPIYNTERFLNKCIESLINQTYNNLQIILVDDGSRDNSLKICEEFSKKDSRISVISGINEGVSCARNKGIAHAKAKYIMFVDSDDYILPNYIEKVYGCMKKNKVDAIKTGWTRFNKDERKKISFINDDYKIFNSNEILSYILTDNKYFNSACTILYSLDIIKKNKIKFDKNIKHAEDTLFFIQYLKKCKTVCYLNNTDYFYRFNNLSASNKVDIDSRIKYCIDSINVYYDLYDELNTNSLISGIVLERINYSLKKILYIHKINYFDFKKIIENFDLNKKFKNIKLDFKFNLKYKVKFVEKIEMWLIAKQNYKLYYIIVRIKKLIKF